MAVEAKRGCGYRKVGGLYIVMPPIFEWKHCDRLNVELDVCPCCGQGIKQSRAFTWVKPSQFLDGDHKVRMDYGPPYEETYALCPEDTCPLCRPALMGEKAALMWVGEKFYPTPAHFMHEMRTIGFSKRVRGVPNDFVFGETWLILAHPKAIRKVEQKDGDEEPKEYFYPGIFTIIKPTHLEKIVTDDISEEDEQELLDRGIKPIKVPADDPDHQ